MQKKELQPGEQDVENYPEEQKERKRVKKAYGLYDTMKRNNIHIMKIPEGEEKEKGTKSIFKAIVAENVPNLGREMHIQVYEVQRTPNRLNLNRTILRHIIMEL